MINPYLPIYFKNDYCKPQVSSKGGKVATALSYFVYFYTLYIKVIFVSCKAH